MIWCRRHWKISWEKCSTHLTFESWCAEERHFCSEMQLEGIIDFIPHLSCEDRSFQVVYRVFSHPMPASVHKLFDNFGLLRVSMVGISNFLSFRRQALTCHRHWHLLLIAAGYRATIIRSLTLHFPPSTKAAGNIRSFEFYKQDVSLSLSSRIVLQKWRITELYWNTRGRELPSKKRRGVPGSFHKVDSDRRFKPRLWILFFYTGTIYGDGPIMANHKIWMVSWYFMCKMINDAL
jgi:hypothetical protein